MSSLPENGEEVGGKCNNFYTKINLFDFVQYSFAPKLQNLTQVSFSLVP